MKPVYDPTTEFFMCELHTKGPVIKKKIMVKDYHNVEAAFQAAKRWVAHNLTNSLTKWRIEDDCSIGPVLESDQDFE